MVGEDPGTFNLNRTDTGKMGDTMRWPGEKYLLALCNADVPTAFKHVVQRAAYDGKRQLEAKEVELRIENLVTRIKQMKLD